MKLLHFQNLRLSLANINEITQYKERGCVLVVGGFVKQKN